MTTRKTKRFLSLLACCCVLIGAASAAGLLPAQAAVGSEKLFTIESFNSAGDKAWGASKGDPGAQNYTVVDSATANGGRGLDGIDGKGIEVNSPGGGITFQTYLSEPLDLSAYGDTTYAIRVRVYLENFSWPNNGQDNDWGFEITSNSEADRKSYRWGKAFLATDGWNEIYYPLSPKYMSLGGSGLTPDLGKINYIRFYSTYNPTGYAVLDDISIVKYTADPGPSDRVGDTITLCDFDDMANVSSGSYDSGDKAQGLASAKAGSWNPGEYPGITWKINAGVDTGLDKSNGAVKVWLYVKDLDSLRQTDGRYEYQLEMTSSKSSDNQELAWTPDQFTLKEGWNEYTLKFSDAMESGEACDLSNINYVRFYVAAEKATLIGIDDLRLVNLDGAWPSTPSSTPESSAPETSTPASTPETSTPETSAPESSAPSVSSTPTASGNASTADGSQAAGDDASTASAGDGGNGWLIPLFIAIGVVILAGGGVAVYFLVIRKKPAVDDTPAGE